MSILDVVPEGNVLQKLGEAHALQDADALLDRVKSDLHPGQLDFMHQIKTRKSWQYQPVTVQAKLGH